MDRVDDSLVPESQRPLPRQMPHRRQMTQGRCVLGKAWAVEAHDTGSGKALMEAKGLQMSCQQQ